MQLFAQAFDVIVAENHFARMGGLLAWGRSELTSPQDMHGWDPNLHVQFTDNVFEEGHHLWPYNTDQGPVYVPGGANTIEPYCIGALSNEQPMSNGVRPSAPSRKSLVTDPSAVDRTASRAHSTGSWCSATIASSHTEACSLVALLHPCWWSETPCATARWACWSMRACTRA